jgi:hypothetical protein
MDGVQMHQSHNHHLLQAGLEVLMVVILKSKAFWGFMLSSSETAPHFRGTYLLSIWLSALSWFFAWLTLGP